MSDKKGLGLAAALSSRGSSEDEPKEPDLGKIFDDACDELMTAAEKKDKKRFSRALRAALKSARED